MSRTVVAALAGAFLLACSGRGADRATPSPAASATAGQDGPEATTATPADSVPSPTPSGPALQVCVEVSPTLASSLSTADAAAQFRAGFTEYARLYQLSSDANEDAGARAWPPYVTPEVQAGCPEGYFGPPDPWGQVKPGCVTTPSAHQLHVFVTGPGERRDWLPQSRHYSWTAYEIGMCSGHQAAEVSSALFLPAPQLQDPNFAAWALADVTGIATILRYPCGHPSSEPRCQGLTPPQP